MMVLNLVRAVGLTTAVILLAGCQKKVEQQLPVRPSAWAPSTEFRREPAPGAPVIRVSAADSLSFDGTLDEDAWKNATTYREFGLQKGTGLLAFPTSVRFLKSGRVLWVGLDCRVPPGKKPDMQASAIDGETIEVWIDPGPTRYEFYQVMFKPDGTLKTSWIPADRLSKFFAVKSQRQADGYTAEIRIELDELTDFGPPPGPNLGFNLARDCRGGWASLVGVVGHVHKPTQFWELDVSDTNLVRQPVNVYGPPFKPGTDVRAIAQELVAAWKNEAAHARNRGWARMQVMIDALEAKLAEDDRDNWGRSQELEVLTWRALVGWRDNRQDIPMRAMLVERLELLASHPGPYPKTQWREEAFVSTFDGTAQGYALRVPEMYDPKTPIPLVILLHGSGLSHIGSGAVFERYEENPPCIIARVNGRQYMRFDKLAERDTLQVIEDIKSQYNIDPDRVYLSGYSAGGNAAMILGATYPHDFAAINCISGGLWGRGKQLETMKNLDVLLVHGDADPVLPPEGTANMLLLELLSYGTPARLSLLPATGHGVTLDGFQEYLLQFRRRKTPRSVACLTDVWNPQPVRNYWITLLQLKLPHAPAGVRGVLSADGKTINLQTANVEEMSLDLGDLERAYPAQAQSAVVDGQTVQLPAGEFVRLKRADRQWSATPSPTRPKPDPTKYRAGGMTQIFAEGSPIIVAPEKLMPAAMKLSHRTVNGFSSSVKIPVIADTAVTDEMLSQHHVVLLGGPALNKAAARLAPMFEKEKVLPKIDQRKIVLDRSRSYDLNDHVTEIITLNPLNHSLRAWLFLTENPDALPPDSPILGGAKGRQEPDIVVWEIKSKSIVDRRVFTSEWEPIPPPWWSE